MRNDSRLLPASILAGCGVIAAGLYLGLRASQPAAPPASSRPLDSAPAATSVAPPSAQAAPPPARVDADAVQKRVQEAAAAAIEKEKREKYLPQCWVPALEENPQPPTSKHFFVLGFDAEGRESVRGLSDIRGESRAEVGACVQRVPMGIRISPPPGIPVNVQVPLEFP